MNDPRPDEPDRVEQIERLAGSVAHDLNNLLTSIKGLAALALQDLAASHPLRRDLEEIRNAAVRATALTTQLKTMSGRRTAEPAAAAPTAADPGRSQGQVILVADDEESVRRLVVRVLERAGYRVLQAGNVADALSQAEAAEGRIDLLLTDVVMPGGGGQQLHRLISSRWPGVRVLYVSGYTDDADVRREAEGPDGGYLGKPFAPEELIATVRRVLDRNTQPLADR
jgi:CheY-like chemotaxis protein